LSSDVPDAGTLGTVCDRTVTAGVIGEKCRSAGRRHRTVTFERVVARPLRGHKSRWGV